MFDILPNFLSSILTLFLPLYASHRALSSRDPSALSPWLTYYVVFSTLLLLETYLSFFLSLLPFYAWLRLFLNLYLVLPQTQGAHLIYTTYIAPFLNQHQQEIEHYISTTHDRLKAGLSASITQLIHFVRENILGLSHLASPQPAQQRGWGESYAQTLLARFNVPFTSASPPSPYIPTAPPPGSPGGATASKDIYTFLSTALSQALASPPLSSPPPTAPSQLQKLAFITSQRERLRALIGALDREEAAALSPEVPPSTAQAADPVTHVKVESAVTATAAGDEGLKKVRSEMDFERVEREDLPGTSGHGQDEQGGAKAAGGGWMPWAWGAGPKPASEEGGAKIVKEEAKGVSSGVDTTERMDTS